jgi:hypothetical protein
MKDAPPDIERVPGVLLVQDHPGGAWYKQRTYRGVQCKKAWQSRGVSFSSGSTQELFRTIQLFELEFEFKNICKRLKKSSKE